MKKYVEERIEELENYSYYLNTYTQKDFDDMKLNGKDEDLLKIEKEFNFTIDELSDIEFLLEEIDIEMKRLGGEK